MHQEANQFVASVKRQYPEFFTGKKVLEVGSLDINGSVRQFFTDCDYIGIDLGAGAGVDQVVDVINFPGRNVYDVVISTETLEHDNCWRSSLQAMHDLLKPNGLLIITCAAPNRPEHGTTRTGSAEASPFTSDYYRNISVEDFASVLPANLFSRSYLGYRGDMDDLYFAGIKAPALNYEQYMREKLREMASRTAVPTEFSSAPPTTLTELVKQRGGIKFPDITEQFEVAPCSCPKLPDANTPQWYCPVHKWHNVDYHGKSGCADIPTVTAEVCTKDRLTTTLPMCISAILNQTRKPEKLVIYNDGEQEKLEEVEPIKSLLRLAIDHLGIQWTVYATEKKGQVACHQHALDNATTNFIWRCDDDELPESDCLENLLAEMGDSVGAVGGLVHHPGGVMPLPEHVTGKLEDVHLGTNIQWFDWNGGPRETEHLYSTFIFSVEAARKAGGYCKELSPVSHREETMLTHNIKRAGYSLIVTPNAKTWHLRQDSGGIRSFTDTSLWEHDDQLFQEYLKVIGHITPDEHLVILDSGLGDHLLFRALLVDEFQRKYPDRKWLLSVCYPEVFENIPNVRMISIAEAKLLVGDKYQDYSLFEYGWHHGNGRHVLDVMREFYGK